MSPAWRGDHGLTGLVPVSPGSLAADVPERRDLLMDKRESN